MTNLRRFIPTIPTLTLLLVAAAMAMPPKVGQRLPSFSIADQFNRRWTNKDFAGSVSVYVLSDREGYDYSTNWTNALVPKYQKKVRFVPVADVTAAPGFLHDYIRDQIKEKIRYTVLLDWKGTLTKALASREGVPNLAIVDAGGVVRHVTAGKGSAAEIQRFTVALDKIIAGS